MPDTKEKIKTVGKKAMPWVLVAASQINVQAANTMTNNQEQSELSTDACKQIMKDQHQQNQEKLDTLKIVYDQGYYVIEDTNADQTSYVVIEDNADEVIKNNIAENTTELNEVFSRPTEIEIKNKEDLANEGVEDAAAFYHHGENKITISEDVYNRKGDDIRKQMEAAGMIDTTKLSAEEIQVMDTSYEAIYRTSVLSHEKKHRNNDEAGLNEEIVSSEFLAKKDMMDEISANMVQAGVALNYYKTTGRMEGFDLLYCCGKDTVKEIKEYVVANKDKLDSEESKKFIAAKVRDGWLSTNNNYQEYYELNQDYHNRQINQKTQQAFNDLTEYLKSGNQDDLKKVEELYTPEKTNEVIAALKEAQGEKAKIILTAAVKEKYGERVKGYHNQAMNNSSHNLDDRGHQSNWIDDHSSQQEYNRRVKTMFSDIPGLGDVSAYVNPDFELNDELKRDLQQFKSPEMQEVINNAANGADNPIDAAKNITKALDPIKQTTLKAKEDGVVTPEEQKNIDMVTYKTIQKLRGIDHASATAKKSFEEAPTQVQSGTFRAAMFDGNSR